MQPVRPLMMLNLVVERALDPLVFLLLWLTAHSRLIWRQQSALKACQLVYTTKYRAVVPVCRDVADDPV